MVLCVAFGTIRRDFPDLSPAAPRRYRAARGVHRTVRHRSEVPGSAGHRALGSHGEDTHSGKKGTVATFEAILGTGAFLTGGQFSLADIALACLIDNLMELLDASLIVPEGAALRDWWNRIRVLEAFLAARPKVGLLFALPSMGCWSSRRIIEHII